MHARFDEEYPEEIAKLDDCLYKLQKYVVRRWLLDDGKRVDGRAIDEIRPLRRRWDCCPARMAPCSPAARPRC